MNNNFPTPLLKQLEEAGVVAGFSVERPQDAVPIAEALLSGGVRAIELTLRTPAGLDAVRAISAAAPEILLGVGTILTPEQGHEAHEAGAHFGVAPGFNPRIVKAAAEVGLPFAPGVATPSELEAALELGCHFLKLFPAGPLGGVDYLRSLTAPYKHLGVRFFPLGGLNADNMIDYLSEPSVAAIGGSWIVKDKHVEAGDWAAIAARAAEARFVLSRLREKITIKEQAAEGMSGSCPAVATGD
ncbi:KHG/KDPG aldolase [Planctomycetes bacterium MalM25]|nr:KHG/KDPG aldolase [Planctomycetes bacterium MalM25]